MQYFYQKLIKSDIARSLIIYVVLFSSCITLLTSAIQLYRDYTSDIFLIRDYLQQVQDVHLKSITAALWASDTKELKTHLEGISQLRDMQFLEIRDQEKVLVSLGVQQSKDVMSRQYMLTYPHRGRDITIGSLTVTASLHGVYQRLIDKIWVIVISNGIKTFLVTGFILIIFHLLITRHLIRIARFTNEFNINTLDRQLKLHRNPKDKQKIDELDLVVSAINQMQVNIKESFVALTASEERFRLINSRIPGIVYQFKIDTNGERSLPYVAPTVETYIGLSAKTVMDDVGKWFALTHPDDLPGLESSIIESMENMTQWDWEGRFICDGDNVRWFHGSSIPVKLQDGSTLWTGVFIDITEQRKVEKEIEQSHARFEVMFNSIPDAIIYADPDRNIQHVNSATTKLFGYEDAELIGNHTKKLYASPEDFVKQRQVRFNPDSKPMLAPYEITYRCKNGKEFLGETVGTPVKSSSGELLGYLGIIRDISERVKIEATLRSMAASGAGLQFKSFMHEMLKGLTELYQCQNASIGQLLPDSQHVQTLAVRMNDKPVDNFQYSLVGTPCQDIINQKKDFILNDASKLYSEDKMLVDMGIESYFGAPLIRSDGTTMGILCVMDTKPFKLDKWMGSILDVFATRAAVELERYLTTQELWKHREYLEQLVIERTAEMATARDAAERANTAKSEFLSRMSHELRTPMNAILGFTQLLKMDTELLNETQRDNLTEIFNAGHHLLGLINEVLDLARIESGKLEIVIDKVSVDDVLQQCISLVRSQIKERKTELIDNISGKGYSVQADFMRLKQVVLNLLSNAVKYNRDYGHITLDSETIDKQRLRINVTDSGHGLTEQEIAKIFTPFERLNTVSKVEGTGIGLVITKHLVGLMGGTIGVESTPTKGSTFWVELVLAGQ